MAWRRRDPRCRLGGLDKGTIIQFPQRGEAEVVHFDEKHPFGEIGGLLLSLVQEQGKEDGPLILLLLGGAEGF